MSCLDLSQCEARRTGVRVPRIARVALAKMPGGKRHRARVGILRIAGMGDP